MFNLVLTITFKQRGLLQEAVKELRIKKVTMMCIDPEYICYIVGRTYERTHVLII